VPSKKSKLSPFFSGRKMMRIRLILLLFITGNAWAYRFTADFANGFYWASLPITVTVEDENPTRKTRLETLSRDAVGEWESRTGLSLWSFQAGSNNIIRWSTNFAAETRMDPNSVLAVAIRYTNGPYFAKTEIVINGGHPYNQILTHLLTTITHELGHTMGLDHSEQMQAVMAPTLQDPYRGLHQDDVMGMNHAFSETEHRQLTRYVSPLAYEKTSSSQPLSCGIVSPVTAASAGNGFLSLALGMLIGLVRKIVKGFKSFF
jgi:hypothetical protein